MTNTQIINMLMAGQDDLLWFNMNSGTLKNEYNDKFIAFKDKKIILADSSLNGLLSKLRQREIDTSRLLIRFVSKVKTLL